MQTGTPIGWKSGQTTFVPIWDRMEGARLCCTHEENELVNMEPHLKQKFSKNVMQRRLSENCGSFLALVSIFFSLGTIIKKQLTLAFGYKNCLYSSAVFLFETF